MKPPPAVPLWTPDLRDRLEASARKLDLISRIMMRCDQQPHPTLNAPCWIWQGATSGSGDGAGRGYGRVRVDGVMSATHRVMFACFNGYLPPGRDVDHLCHNRLCCNPAHLESTTRKQNCNNRRN